MAEAWAVGEPVPALGPTPGRTMEPVFPLTDPRGATAPARPSASRSIAARIR